MLKKTKWVVIPIFALIAISIAGYLIYRPNEFELRESRLIESAKEAVAAKLLDGESARFRNVRLVPPFNGNIVCGEVNGKNRYGAYTGFVRFDAVIDSGSSPNVEMESDSSYTLVKERCEN